MENVRASFGCRNGNEGCRVTRVQMPNLCPVSTSYFTGAPQDVDGRDEPGHDEGKLATRRAAASFRLILRAGAAGVSKDGAAMVRTRPAAAPHHRGRERC